MCFVKSSEYEYISFRKNQLWQWQTLNFWLLKITNNPMSSLFQAMNRSNISQKIKYLTGNCVILEGAGDLDHYSCVEKFNSSCPLEHYFDEEVYKCEWSLLKKFNDTLLVIFSNFRFFKIVFYFLVDIKGRW